MTLNVWNFVAGCEDTGVAGHVYTGSLTVSAVERAYGVSVLGTGTQFDDSSNSLVVGNKHAATFNQAFNGRIAFAGIWNRALSLGEIKDQQFYPHKTSGCVLFLHLGFTGTGTQPDWSGNANAGTVTGATVDAHVPLGNPFASDEWQPYVVVPPTGFVPRLMLLGVG